MWNDSNMYSSPLSLLQLPASALPEVTGRLAQPGDAVARFSQDGKTLADLRTLVPEADFRQAAEVTVDVGFVCKKCHMVYPAEVLCLNHQRSGCFQGKGDVKATLKLVQCHVECRACRERFTTIVDFKFHCDMDRHVKRVQKIQREAATAQANVASQFEAMQKMQQNANSVAASQFDALQKMQQNASSQFDALQKMQQNANSVAAANQFDALQKMQNANNQFDALQKMQNANSIVANQFDALQKIQREAAAATSVANHFDALATRMAMANNNPPNNNNNNNTFANNTFDGNASAAGLLGRNGLVPDMAQLFFSGMGMDSIRLGMGLDPEQNEPASKSKTQQVVGCGGDAGVSIS